MQKFWALSDPCISFSDLFMIWTRDDFEGVSGQDEGGT